MNIIKRICASILLLSFSMGVYADNLNIALVNIQEILAKSPEMVKIKALLQSEFKTRDEEMLKLDRSLKENSEKLQRDGAIMNEAERGKLERNVATSQRELQRLQTAFREDASARQQEEVQKHLEKLRVTINKFAEEKKYDLLLHTEVAIYFKDKFDITNEIIEQLKKQN